jgi:hypothetical protein
VIAPAAWAAGPPFDSSSRIYAESQVRPLRIAIAMREPLSARPCRRVIRALCAKWGGGISALVTLDAQFLLTPSARTILRAFDPDWVCIYNASSFRTLKQMRAQLDEIEVSPFWVSRFNDELQGDRGWIPASLSDARASAPTRVLDDVRGVPPTTVAVVGLSAADLPPPDPKASREILDIASSRPLVEETPAALASPEPPLALWGLPFFYHSTDSWDHALALWNLRAVRGLAGHGDDRALSEYIASALSRRSAGRIEVVIADGLTRLAEEAIASVGPRLIATPLNRFRWPRRPARTPWIGRRGENDDMPIVDGRFEFPLRRPTYATLPGVTGSEPTGVYAIELDLHLPSDDDRLAGMPPRSALANLIVPFRWDARPAEHLRRRQVRSRVARDGSSVLAVHPSRDLRGVALAIPTVTEMLNAMGRGARFSLSDKGRFGQWSVNHVGGLEAVHTTLTDPRSRALISEFQKHHLGGPITGAYRRSMTLDEMRRAFTSSRRRGDLPRRIPGGWTDESWLRAWVSRLVDAGFLQLGIRIKCAECLAGSLVRVGEFGQSDFCPRCGLATRTPAMPEMAYQLNEAAHEFLSKRGDVTALALAAIRRRSIKSFAWGFDHLVRWSASQDDVNEFDFAAVADGRLLIGESKSAARFTETDFRRLKRLAKLLRPAVVVFASDRECEGGCTPVCSRPSRPYWATSDSSLPSGDRNAPGPRDRMISLRQELLPLGIRVAALCRADLFAPYRQSRRRFFLS